MFSNGTEYMIFLDEHCFKCYRYKTDKEGIPTINSCRIEKEIAGTSWGRNGIPREVQKEGMRYVCTKFREIGKHKQDRRKYQRREIEGQTKL